MAKYPNFNYLDQIQDTTIDLTKYLSKFSDSNFDLNFRNNQPVVATVKNIFERLTLVDDFKERGGQFFEYRIDEGFLIEDVAIRFYGSEDFWWVVAFWNKMNNLFLDWPMIDEQLVDISTKLSNTEDKYPQSVYYNILFEENEVKRPIEILRRSQISDLVFQIKNSITTTDASGRTLRIRV